MRFHMTIDDAGIAPTLEHSRSAVLGASFTPGPVPHAADEALDRWSLFDECYREHMARRALEELFASGEMSAFEY